MPFSLSDDRNHLQREIKRLLIECESLRNDVDQQQLIISNIASLRMEHNALQQELLHRLNSIW